MEASRGTLFQKFHSLKLKTNATINLCSLQHTYDNNVQEIVEIQIYLGTFLRTVFGVS